MSDWRAGSGNWRADMSPATFSPSVSTRVVTRHELLPVPRSLLDVRCIRCGFPVVSRPSGCRNPCCNCGFVYPLGDCSD